MLLEYGSRKKCTSIVAEPTVEGIAALRSDERVIALIAHESVRAIFAVQSVMAWVTRKPVIPADSEH